MRLRPTTGTGRFVDVASAAVATNGPAGGRDAYPDDVKDRLVSATRGRAS
jgi:hypothetical protein